MKKIKNQYDVKIGDVFCMSKPCGRNGITQRFFQVVNLKGKKQIIIKEIELEKVGKNEKKEDLVSPCKDKFLKNSLYIENNNIGATKVVQKEFNSDIKEIIYISFNYYFRESIHHNHICKTNCYEIAELWDNTPKIYYIDYID